jgi:cell division cycle protein 37
MAIDYSKWDKLELSDDSDVEVHPNVDKSSFIRWKQRDIHEKRIQREQQIKGLQVQKEMYTQLNKRVDKMLLALDDDQLKSEMERNSFLSDHFDKTEKCTLEENQDAPTYNQMVEDLFTQIQDDLKKEKEDVNGFNIKKKLIEHRQKIETVLKQIDPRIQEFENEKHAHITSDDIHDAWNTSIINKVNKSDDLKSQEKLPEKSSSSNSTTTTIENLNSPSNKPIEKQPSKLIKDLDELELLKETIDFSNLATLKACGAFILEHPFIACSHQKDALLMKAFDYQLNDDEPRAIDIITKGILLQFCADLLENPPYPHMPMDIRLNYVKQLFSQLEKENAPGKNAYEQECARMIEHVRERCKIIKQEQDEEDKNKEQNDDELVEQIQLRSVDPNSELIVTIPDEGSKEYEIYNKLPEKMKVALKTGSLDEVNKVFATIPIDEAEEMLDQFNECGVIGIQALLDTEDQFEELAENEKKFEQMRKAAENVNINDKLNELKDQN